MSDSHSNSRFAGSISAIGDRKGAVRMEDVYDTGADDPRASQQSAGRAIDIAERFGSRDMVMQLTNVSAAAAVETGARPPSPAFTSAPARAASLSMTRALMSSSAVMRLSR